VSGDQTQLLDCRANIRDNKAASATFRSMDANVDGCIDISEFSTTTVARLQGHSEREVLTKLYDMIEQRFSGRYHWDISHSCCGHRGILPFLQVLEKDIACESLDASDCGLDNESIEALALALRHHPV
jgi:cobyrinic acid a,c-diamide synthase